MEKLFPYQKTGAWFLASKRGACLYDEMGLGKSAQAITACALTGADSVWVICRAVARENWRREFEKFSTRPPKELTITSYEGAEKELSLGKKYDVLIVDESHYVKEPNAKRTRSVLGKTGAIHRARRAYLLTGTPAPNHAGEMWTTLYTLGCTKLNYQQFVERFCTYRDTSYGRQITGTDVGPDKVADLRRMLEPISLRRTKEDVNLELPPIFFTNITVPPGRFELWNCLSFRKYVHPKDRTHELEEDIERELGVVKGICNGAFTELAMDALEANAKSIMTLRRYNSMQKVESVVNLVKEELDNKEYEKIVIFGIHRDTLVTLQEKLKDYGAVLVFGGTKPERMTARIDAFQNLPSCKVFVAQLHTAGTSLTLTAANQIIFIDQDWVPGNNLQAAARCHRIGQTKPVTVRCVSLEKSIDQHIGAILTRKTREISELMNGVYEKPKPTIKHLL